MTRKQMIEAVIDILEDIQPAANLGDYKAVADRVVDKIIQESEPGTTDDKLRPGQTVKEALDRCIEIARERQSTCDRRIGPQNSAAREFSLAITAMEDAQMRYARGRHMQQGTFDPSDVDRWLADGEDPAAKVSERDRAAGKKELDINLPSASSQGGDPEEG